MKVNMEKSFLIINHCAVAEEFSITNTFPAQRKPLSEGFKIIPPTLLITIEALPCPENNFSFC
jgi:hypothetical protein